LSLGRELGQPTCFLTGTGGMNDSPESRRITMGWRSGVELKKSTHSKEKSLSKQPVCFPVRVGWVPCDAAVGTWWQVPALAVCIGWLLPRAPRGMIGPRPTADVWLNFMWCVGDLKQVYAVPVRYQRPRGELTAVEGAWAAGVRHSVAVVW
jgi:hypothetical protein